MGKDGIRHGTRSTFNSSGSWLRSEWHVNKKTFSKKRGTSFSSIRARGGQRPCYASISDSPTYTAVEFSASHRNLNSYPNPKTQSVTRTLTEGHQKNEPRIFLPSGVHTKPKHKTNPELSLSLGLGLVFWLVFVLFCTLQGKNILGSFFCSSYPLLFIVLSPVAKCPTPTPHKYKGRDSTIFLYFCWYSLATSSFVNCFYYNWFWIKFFF